MNAITKATPPSGEVSIVPPQGGAALYRVSTDAAALCRDIVVATASTIQGRKYVQVEGWQAIALAHGCAASSGDVVKLEDGSVSATGRVIRIDTGTLIASAEGYVGADEPTWFGGKNAYGKILPKRPDYAIRAMAQTRAISRACRSAFAHVVVMMNAGLSTTPAEEVPDEGFDRIQAAPQPPKPSAPSRGSQTLDAQVLPPDDKPKPRTRRDFLNELHATLAACHTIDEVDAVAQSETVIAALKSFTNGALAELNALLAEAIHRTQTDPDPGTAESVAAEADGWPGPT